MDEMKLLSYFNGELSEEEVLQVETWSEASEENRKLLEQIYYTAFVGDRVAVMNSVDVEGSLKKLKVAMKPKESAVKKHWSVGWKRYVIPLAAFFTGIVFTIGFSYLALNKTSNYIVATTAGQRAQFVLPDGSKVWLNASTQLAYKTSLWSRERQVNLTGEAYFEVAKDAKKPFVVQAGEIDVEVLGTCFDLDSYSSGEFVETALLNGSVKISGKALKDPVYLKPNELFRYRKSDQIASVEEAKVGLYADWIKDRLVFDNDCLADILISMEGRYNMEIECPKQFAASTRLSFTIRQESIEEVMEAMSLIAPIRYEIKSGKVYIIPK